MGELLCHEYREIYGIESVVLRIFSAYGPGLAKQVVFDIYQKFAHLDQVSLFGNGNESRDFIYATDIAAAVELVASSSKASGVYNLASGRETSIRELAETIQSILGSEKAISFSQQERKGDPGRWRADISRIQALGFEPKTSLVDGLKLVAEHL